MALRRGLQPSGERKREGGGKSEAKSQIEPEQEARLVSIYVLVQAIGGSNVRMLA
jgi:hypothetical protein